MRYFNNIWERFKSWEPFMFKNKNLNGLYIILNLTIYLSFCSSDNYDRLVCLNGVLIKISKDFKMNLDIYEAKIRHGQFVFDFQSYFYFDCSKPSEYSLFFGRWQQCTRMRNVRLFWTVSLTMQNYIILIIKESNNIISFKFFWQK